MDQASANHVEEVRRLAAHFKELVIVLLEGILLGAGFAVLGELLQGQYPFLARCLDWMCAVALCADVVLFAILANKPNDRLMELRIERDMHQLLREKL